MSQKFTYRLYLGGFLILLFCLFYYQVIKGDHYLERAKNNYVKISPLRSIRGRIFDRNSFALAYDVPSFDIAVIPYQIRKKRTRLFRELARELNCDINLIYKNYKRKLINFFSPVSIVFDLDKIVALKLAEKFSDDVLINPQPQRFYHNAYEFAHLIGYVKEASHFYESLKRYGYAPLERAGFKGIEQYYDSYLKGEDGGDLIEVNASGKMVGFLGKRLPERGKDIHLTVDSRIQKIAYQMLKGKKGIIIFMDSKCGEIISLVSYPSFDPNKFIKGRGVKKFLKSKDKSMLNRAIQASYPLGSTFKPIVGIGGLEEKKIEPSTIFNCKGETEIGMTIFRCWDTHHALDLYKGLAYSCNVYFYNLGLILGADTIAKWAKEFGLDSFTEIDLPYEKKGFVPTPLWKGKALKQYWFPGDTLNLSIGQGYLEATPLEILIAINVFANEGYRVKPYLLKKVANEDSRLVKREYLGVSLKNLQVIKKGLIEAVEIEGGTGHILKRLNLKIAGKTGTAENPGLPHAWFIGFLPHDQPKYSICVFLENGGSSYEALRITYNFLKRLKAEGLI